MRTPLGHSHICHIASRWTISRFGWYYNKQYETWILKRKNHKSHSNLSYSVGFDWHNYYKDDVFVLFVLMIFIIYFSIKFPLSLIKMSLHCVGQGDVIREPKLLNWPTWKDWLKVIFFKLLQNVTFDYGKAFLSLVFIL